MAVKGKKVAVASRKAARVIVSAKKKVTSRSKPEVAAKGKKVASRPSTAAAAREKKVAPRSKPAVVVPVKEKQVKTKVTIGGAMKPMKMHSAKRIQTAEGWRRAQLRALQARKQKGAKK